MAIRALATGGSEKGVITAAVLSACREEGIEFKSFFGVSVGLLCVIAHVLGLYDELESVFKNLNVKKDLQDMNSKDLALAMLVSWADSWRLTRWALNHFPWIKNALPPKKHAKSVFKDKFIRMLVDKYITLENYEILKSKPLIEFPVFNLTTGEVEIKSTQDNIHYELFKKYVLTAISIPGLYPGQKIEGNFIVDGGFVNNIALESAWYRCNNGDILLIFHNFPKKAPEIEMTDDWRFWWWLAIERRHIIEAADSMQLLNRWVNFCQSTEKRFNKYLPWRWFMGKPQNKLYRFSERVYLGYISRKLKFPIIKKVEFYPDHNLNLFKIPSPAKEDLREAFDCSRYNAREIIRQEVLSYIS